MENNKQRGLLTLSLGLLVLTACSDTSPELAIKAASRPATVASSPSAHRPNYAPPNPHLADSVLPIGHINSAQSTGMDNAGPSGPTEELSQENGGLICTQLGSGHFGTRYLAL